MSEEITDLDLLKKEADELNVSYHPSIGEEKLKEKIREAKAAKQEEVAKPVGPKKESISEIRKRAAELVRIRVTCMDPARSEWEGDFFSCGNSKIGMFTKYVPFGVEWHVPRILYNMIKDKKCQVFHTVRDARGNKGRKGKLINAYAVEVLPSLTKAELDDLARRQAMANGTSEG